MVKTFQYSLSIHLSLLSIEHCFQVTLKSIIMLNLASSILILFGIFILTLSVHEKFDLINFKNKVLEDDRVWLLEFYSPMCGSCTEFSPTWSKLETSAKSIVTSKVNIDDKAGMELAKALGVLEEGLPGVRIFTSKTGNGISIVAGIHIYIILL